MVFRLKLKTLYIFGSFSLDLSSFISTFVNNIKCLGLSMLHSFEGRLKMTHLWRQRLIEKKMKYLKIYRKTNVRTKLDIVIEVSFYTMHTISTVNQRYTDSIMLFTISVHRLLDIKLKRLVDNNCWLTNLK